MTLSVLTALPAAAAVPVTSTGTLFAQQQPGGEGADFGKSSPVGLLLLLVFLVAVVFLVRSMTKHLKRVPSSFDGEGDGATGEDRADDAHRTDGEGRVDEPGRVDEQGRVDEPGRVDDEDRADEAVAAGGSDHPGGPERPVGDTGEPAATGRE